MTRSQMNHVGITVSDLDASIEFYGSMFGMETLVRADPSGEIVERTVGVPNAAMRLAILAGENGMIELIEYVRSAGEQRAPSTNDVGSAHVCFQVGDIEAAYQELMAKGARFVSPPSPPLDEGGTRIVFLSDPDGIPVEILQPGVGESLQDKLAALSAA